MNSTGLTATLYFHMSGIAKEDFVDTSVHFKREGVLFGKELYQDLKSRNTKKPRGICA